jgi:hypothetical protein
VFIGPLPSNGSTCHNIFVLVSLPSYYTGPFCGKSHFHSFHEWSIVISSDYPGARRGKIKKKYGCSLHWNNPGLLHLLPSSCSHAPYVTNTHAHTHTLSRQGQNLASRTSPRESAYTTNKQTNKRPVLVVTYLSSS